MTKFCTILFLIFTIGCQSPSDKIVEEFKTVDKSLEKSSKIIDSANNDLYKKLTAQLNCSVKENGDSLVVYIETLKEALKNYSLKNFPAKNGTEFEDLETSNKLMLQNKRGDILFKMIQSFNQTALSCNTTKATQQEVADIFDITHFKNAAGFNEMYFKNIPTVAALTMLSSFQNKIKNAQNIIVNGVTQP